MGIKPIPIEIRIESYIDRTDINGCWLWTGGKVMGYAVSSIPNPQRQIRLHRWMWEREHGPIPDGLLVCHRCDVRNCANPQHLFLGTNTDNLKDMAAKGRSTHGAKNPAARLTEEQVVAIRATVGLSQLQLAAKFNVSKGAIKHIQKRRTWQRV